MKSAFSTLYTFVSQNVISVSEISVVHLIVVWNVYFFYFLYDSIPLRENTSSIYLFHTNNFLQLCLSISLSILGHEIFAKAMAIFVPVAVPSVCRWPFPLNWKEF